MSLSSKLVEPKEGVMETSDLQLEWFTELKKTHSLDYQYIIKDIKGYEPTARWRDT